MDRSLRVENLLPQNVGQLSTTCSNVLKWPNGELLVAVDHNQLQTRASESIDPINWSHTPPPCAVPSEPRVHRINLCSLSRESTLQPSEFEATALPTLPLRVWQCSFGRAEWAGHSAEWAGHSAEWTGQVQSWAYRVEEEIERNIYCVERVEMVPCRVVH